MTDYNKHSVDATLSRLEQKLDDFLAVQVKQQKDIEDLKQWRWFSTGIGAGAGWLASFFTHGK